MHSAPDPRPSMPTSQALSLPPGASASPGQATPPLWSLIGPGLAGLVALYLLTAPLGREWTVIRLSLHTGEGMMIAIFLGYLVPAAASSAAGMLAGRRWPAAVAAPGILLMFLGVLVIALAPSAPALLGGRVMAGLGAGGAVGTAAVLALHHGRTTTAVVAILAALGLVSGPALGWVVVTVSSWRAVFLLALPGILLALLVTVVAGIVRLALRGNRPAPSVPSGR